MTTPKHCPGFEQFKSLKAFMCKCPTCGKEKEIFSDEFDRKHVCSGCGKEIDFTKCTIEGAGGTGTPSEEALIFSVLPLLTTCKG